jgi:hypothetical protein
MTGDIEEAQSLSERLVPVLSAAIGKAVDIAIVVHKVRGIYRSGEALEQLPEQQLCGWRVLARQNLMNVSETITSGPVDMLKFGGFDDSKEELQQEKGLEYAQ